jgi:hypothetical protein
MGRNDKFLEKKFAKYSLRWGWGVDEIAKSPVHSPEKLGIHLYILEVSHFKFA